MVDQTSAGPMGAQPDVWDLLPGYAMHTLDAEERQAVEQLLSSDADARRALDEYREVVAAFTVETAPPADLRASVLDAVLSTTQEPAPSRAVGSVESTGAAGSAAAAGPAAPVAGGEVVDLASRRRRRWGSAVAAVAAAAAIAVPTTIAVQVSAERDQLREQSEIVSEMLVDPNMSVLRGPVEGGGAASVLVAGQDMYFQADDLPEPDAGTAYQLWVMAADGSVSSAGLLSLTDGEASSLVQDTEGVGLAVSVEPESGSDQPTTTPIVVLGA